MSDPDTATTDINALLTKIQGDDAGDPKTAAKKENDGVTPPANEPKPEEQSEDAKLAAARAAKAEEVLKEVEDKKIAYETEGMSETQLDLAKQGIVCANPETAEITKLAFVLYHRAQKQEEENQKIAAAQKQAADQYRYTCALQCSDVLLSGPDGAKVAAQHFPTQIVDPDFQRLLTPKAQDVLKVAMSQALLPQYNQDGMPISRRDNNGDDGGMISRTLDNAAGTTVAHGDVPTPGAQQDVPDRGMEHDTNMPGNPGVNNGQEIRSTQARFDK